MNFIRRLFTISNIILLFAIALIPYSIRNCNDASIKFEQLKKHVGVIQEKAMISEVIDSQWKNFSHIVNFKLVNDNEKYSVSFSPLRVNTLVNIGDSVEFYTKTIAPQQRDLIPDFNEVKNFHVEIFHLVSKKYTDPIVDFKDYNSSLKTNAWGGPILCIIFFVWYFIRRRSFNNDPLIIDP